MSLQLPLCPSGLWLRGHSPSKFTVHPLLSLSFSLSLSLSTLGWSNSCRVLSIYLLFHTCMYFGRDFENIFCKNDTYVNMHVSISIAWKRNIKSISMIIAAIHVVISHDCWPLSCLKCMSFWVISPRDYLTASWQNNCRI